MQGEPRAKRNEKVDREFDPTSGREKAARVRDGPLVCVYDEVSEPLGLGVLSNKVSYLSYLPADVCGLLATYVFYDPRQSYATAQAIFTLPCLIHTTYTAVWDDILRNYARFMYRAYYSTNNHYARNYLNYDGTIDYTRTLATIQSELGRIERENGLFVPLGDSQTNRAVWIYAYTHQLDRYLVNLRLVVTKDLQVYLQSSAQNTSPACRAVTERVFSLPGLLSTLTSELDHALRVLYGLDPSAAENFILEQAPTSYPFYCNITQRLAYPFCHYMVQTYARDVIVRYPFSAARSQQIPGCTPFTRGLNWSRAYILAAAITDDVTIFTDVLNELECTVPQLLVSVRQFSFYGDVLAMRVLIEADAAALVSHFELWDILLASPHNPGVFTTPRLRAALIARGTRLTWQQCMGACKPNTLAEDILPFLPIDASPLTLLAEKTIPCSGLFIALVQRHHQGTTLDLDDIYDFLCGGEPAVTSDDVSRHKLAMITPYLLPVQRTNETSFRTLVAALDANWVEELNLSEYLAFYRLFLLYHSQDQIVRDGELERREKPPLSLRPFRCYDICRLEHTTTEEDEDNGGDNESEVDSNPRPDTPVLFTIPPVSYTRVLVVHAPEYKGEIVAGAQLLSTKNGPPWTNERIHICLPANSTCVLGNVCQDSVRCAYDCDINDVGWLQTEFQLRYSNV